MTIMKSNNKQSVEKVPAVISAAAAARRKSNRASQRSSSNAKQLRTTARPAAACTKRRAGVPMEEITTTTTTMKRNQFKKSRVANSSSNTNMGRVMPRVVSTTVTPSPRLAAASPQHAPPANAASAAVAASTPTQGYSDASSPPSGLARSNTSRVPQSVYDLFALPGNDTSCSTNTSWYDSIRHWEYLTGAMCHDGGGGGSSSSTALSHRYDVDGTQIECNLTYWYTYGREYYQALLEREQKTKLECLPAKTPVEGEGEDFMSPEERKKADRESSESGSEGHSDKENVPPQDSAPHEASQPKTQSSSKAAASGGICTRSQSQSKRSSRTSTANNGTGMASQPATDPQQECRTLQEELELELGGTTTTTASSGVGPTVVVDMTQTKQAEIMSDDAWTKSRRCHDSPSTSSTSSSASSSSSSSSCSSCHDHNNENEHEADYPLNEEEENSRDSISSLGSSMGSRPSSFASSPSSPSAASSSSSCSSSSVSGNVALMAAYPSHPDITPHMRLVLVDWLIEVTEECKLGGHTLHHCIKLLDRVLALELPKRGDGEEYEDDGDEDEEYGEEEKKKGWYGGGVEPINRKMLQLVGCACMLIAAKQEEIRPPHVDDFVYLSDNSYSSKDIVDMEMKICISLKFDLLTVHSLHYVEAFVKAGCVEYGNGGLARGGGAARWRRHGLGMGMGMPPLGLGLATSQLFSNAHDSAHGTAESDYQVSCIPGGMVPSSTTADKKPRQAGRKRKAKRQLCSSSLEEGEDTPHHQLPHSHSNSQAQASIHDRDTPKMQARNFHRLYVMTKYLLELSLMDHLLSNEPPSLIAAAAVYLAKVTLGMKRPRSGGCKENVVWNDTLRYYTGYDAAVLEGTVWQLHKLQSAGEGAKYHSAYTKYEKSKYLSIAHRTTPDELDMGFD